jgi:hypothetical protein
MGLRSVLIASMVFAGMALAAAQQAPAARPAAGAATGTVNQVMRGIMFPNSNVVFASQDTNPAELKQAADPAAATDPLVSIYGGWAAVENASIALAEAASLLSVPRQCSNGVAAPVTAPEWTGFVQGLREAGQASLKAAQSKNQDMMVEAADKVTAACGACHDKYREKRTGPVDRCKP